MITGIPITNESLDPQIQNIENALSQFSKDDF